MTPEFLSRPFLFAARALAVSALPLTFALSALTLTGCKKPVEADTVDTTPPVHVESADVTVIDAPVTLRLTGSLKGMKESFVAANASGRVLKTFVERGDEVKEGAMIAQLDTSSAALALRQAQVDVKTQKTLDEINQKECARYEQLLASKAISSAEYDQVSSRCKTSVLGREAAEARQNIAAKNVGDGAIRAPFSGIISERFVEIGEFVSPQARVVSIVQGGDLRLEMTVPEANIAAVKQGANVDFEVVAYPGKIFKGTVRFLSGSVREATRDLVVEAVAPNPEKILRPGMFADVSVTTGSEKLPSVPVAAIFERQEKKRVYVITEGHLEERVLQPGPEVDGRLTAHSGVKAGEKVVVGKLAALINGAKVE